MHYAGRYRIFDTGAIVASPLAGRSNKVTRASLIQPDDAMAGGVELPDEPMRLIGDVAASVIEARRAGKPVICFTGAHLIKNGLGLLLADLAERNWVTLIAGNGATAIHDFELALIGETSENVPNALPEGRFGMADSFALLNEAIRIGDGELLGLGEALGRAVCDGQFGARIFAAAEKLLDAATPREFRHPECSLLARAWRAGVPVTIHVGIGTDVTDQHGNFDGRAKGGTSGRDFLIFAGEVARLAGGVVLNIGSAVTGPEVLLKAVSMAANIGRPPAGLLAADFDLRPHDAGHMTDEAACGYYYRDQKSVVTRIPAAFGGRGIYVCGDQRAAFPALYRAIRLLGGHAA